MPLALLLAAAIGQSTPDAAWFGEARFGMFLHWGPVSLQGTEIGWSRGGERRGTGGTGSVPVEVYDNLYRQFNPTAFDARAYVRLAAEAGMKYIVLTTKHHDGFCMFGTKLTDYNILNSPYGRDITAELADACHEAGMRLGFYYSPPDWHHPDYRTPNHARYVEYLHGQLIELCSNYGKVDVLWFDGLGGTADDWQSEAILPKLRALQPTMLINNRFGLPEDFDTPEQRVGAFQRDRRWESCITIGTQWAWKPDDRIKQADEVLQTLLRCAGGDGNLLLNLGPQPNGEIEPYQASVLKTVGDWLRTYPESVYGTRGGPFKPGPWGVSTCAGNSVYLHVFEFERDGLRLPALPAHVERAEVLGGAGAWPSRRAVGCSWRCRGPSIRAPTPW